uniref:GMPS ATP-PPase domain-containing protein n=1 Tax=Steinernema glaseri TaxID=37863 RepID=A0A1I7ZME7_9BILA
MCLRGTQPSNCSKIGSRNSTQQPQLPLNDSSVIVTLDQHDRKRPEPHRIAEVVSSTCSTEGSSAFVASNSKNRIHATAENSISLVVKSPLLNGPKIAVHQASTAGKPTRNVIASPLRTIEYQPMKRSGSPSLLTNNKTSEKNSEDADVEPPLAKLSARADSLASCQSAVPDSFFRDCLDRGSASSLRTSEVQECTVMADISSLMDELVDNVSSLFEGGMCLNADSDTTKKGENLIIKKFTNGQKCPFEARSVNKIAILDSSMKFGMLLDRKVRKCGYYSDTLPMNTKAVDVLTQGFEAVIIGGDLNNCYANECQVDPQLFTCGIPVLGICQGFHAVNTHFGGRSGKGVIVDDGEETVVMDITSPLFEGLSSTELVYLRKGECVKSDTVAKSCSVIATSSSGNVAGIANVANRIYAVQFQPEHDLTECGLKLLKNFLHKICGFPPLYDLDYREAECIYKIQESLGENSALVLASGGLISTVSIKILQKALGHDRVHAVHIDTGLNRYNESEEVIKTLAENGIHVHFLPLEQDFLGAEIMNDSGRFMWMRSACSADDKKKLVVESFVTAKNKIIKQLALNYYDTCLIQATQRSDLIRREFREKLFQDFSDDYIDIPHSNVYHPLQDFYRDELMELAEKYRLSEDIVNRYPFPAAGLASRIICSEGPYLDCDYELIQERLCWLCEMWRVPLEGMQDNPELEETINNLSADEFAFLRSQDFELEASLIPMKVRGYTGGCRKDSYIVALSTNADPIPWTFIAFFATIIPKIIPSITRVVFAFGKKISHNVDDLTESNVNLITATKLRRADKVANMTLAGYLYDDIPAPGLKDCRKKIKEMPVMLLPIHFDRPEFTFPSRNWSVCLRPVVYSDYGTVKPAVPGVDLPESTVLKMAERVKSTVPFINRVLLDLTSFPPGTTEWE